MTRLRANLLLLLAATIWGSAFVAQSTAMGSLGPLAFVGLRFLLSAAAVLPFAIREARAAQLRATPADLSLVLLVGMIFLVGNVLQQVGITDTSVTNAGFLTGLYVVMVPFMSWVVFRAPPAPVVWPAVALSVCGTFMLGGGHLGALTDGDLLILACAVFWAMHVTVVGLAVARSSRPYLISVAQFALCGAAAFALALVLEPLSLAAVRAAKWELLYAGLLSGGLGFTLQVVAQRWTPPADAAVILSSEALFAALAGGVLLGDRLDAVGWAGAGAIFSAILLVQIVPIMRLRRLRAA